MLQDETNQESTDQHAAEKLLRENRDLLETLAESSLPIAEDCQRALDELDDA